MKRSNHQPCTEIRQMEDNQPVPASTTTPSAVNQLELKTRAEFVKYYRHLTLDPNTAYRELSLSQGNRSVELKDLVQDYPYRPERFTHLWQVMCKEHLSERSYWEVEWTGSIEIAVCYEDIGRSDYYHECAFGCNENSWSLDLNKKKRCFRHNDVEISLPEHQLSRVAVYLDHSAGVLAFYSVSGDTLSLIHRVQTTFMKPLYPGLWVADHADLCDLR
ncbi:stonustoxin subunit beta-like [Gadus chalcogrammus]|uniref:stonustoxin subunit beta-like n=1 Tax=Gadus chalcogrammus TaxID=1042646 RepID=UPI0024C33A0C|nr:stonustoxin subunit beta-like [Gadus chalcogrammus]